VRARLAVTMTMVALAGCSKSPVETPAAAAPQAQIPADWQGRWTGPEGTYLDIARDGGGHKVTISNLDGPATYPAEPAAGGLSFERNGVRETLHATDGAGTGMKWLADKTRCLTVKPGEGFCRE
jgi:hypothetical protein